MNVCDTSFERAKTAVLRGGDFLDCISVLKEKIRLLFEPLSPGIRASITRTDIESQVPDLRVDWIIGKGMVWKRIDFSKPGSTARDLSIKLAARLCFYVNAMYLRCKQTEL